MRLLVTRLLWAFDLSEEDGAKIEFDDFPMMMMVEKQPLYVRLKARSGVEYKGLPPGVVVVDREKKIQVKSK